MAKTRTLKTQTELSTDSGSLEELNNTEPQIQTAEQKTAAPETEQETAAADETTSDKPVERPPNILAQVLEAEIIKQQQSGDTNAPAVQQFTQNSLSINTGAANVLFTALPVNTADQQTTGASGSQPVRRGGFVTHGVSPTNFK
jgi:hypothetical protein